MISEIPPFTGFSPETFKYFAELSENNSFSWFTENRERYDNYVVMISKSFINNISPFFNQIEPKINTEPKFDKTMLRMNLDIRFSPGAPYRTYFLIHFRRFKKDSEFFLFINKKGIEYGLMINNTLANEVLFNKNLPGHKDELVETFNKFDLNGNFNFYEMKRTPELLAKNFNIEKDFNRMALTKLFLLQKEISKDSEILYSPDILLEVIKTFSQLFTVYCFCVSHNPLAMIEEFENQIGLLR
ncbi:MAG: DUF2461 family protein [Ignavibacteriales bacterium]|nr:MAG: DUF2461 family protein [Ignavibacteriales bacterium]